MGVSLSMRLTLGMSVRERVSVRVSDAESAADCLSLSVGVGVSSVVPMKIPVFTSRKAALVPEMGLVPPIHTKFTY